jgi:hypothetical protein
LFFVLGFWFFWKNCANVPSRSRRWRMRSMRWKTTTVSCKWSTYPFFMTVWVALWNLEVYLMCQRFDSVFIG